MPQRVACNPSNTAGSHPPQPRWGNGSAASRGFWMQGGNSQSCFGPCKPRASRAALYLLLLDSVMQKRSRKRKRCLRAGPLQYGCLRSTARSPESPHLQVHGEGTRVQCQDVVGRVVCGSCRQASASFLPPAHRRGNASSTNVPLAPQPPFFPLSPPPAFTSTTPLNPPHTDPQSPCMPKHIHPSLLHSRHSAPPNPCANPLAPLNPTTCGRMAGGGQSPLTPPPSRDG